MQDIAYIYIKIRGTRIYGYKRVYLIFDKTATTPFLVDFIVLLTDAHKTFDIYIYIYIYILVHMLLLITIAYNPLY